jgi:gamma-glutamyl hercynylcysteine S-oxide synthase
MSLGLNTGAAALDDPQTDRSAGREVLSLALIDSRNHLLQRLAHDESEPALRLAARAGWFAEHWINGFVQRGRGEAADPTAVRLAGIEPRVAAWCEGRDLPHPDQLRAYLQQTLEDTLDLLLQAEDSDAGLHFYRLALRHEDRLAEALVLLAVQQGRSAVAGGGIAAGISPPTRAERAPLWLPAQRWRLGSERGGSVPEGERWAHAVDLPEFEIDAQAVSWARYAEFALDGGYDREALWTRAGWAWLQQDGRRAPLGVAQLAGGVLLERAGRLQRVPAQQAVVGVTRFEAEAWCQWAGRRLPTEPEWELAACTAASRGFVWGDVLEWATGSARPWPGHAPVPGDIDPVPPEPGRVDHGLLAPPQRILTGVQRGAAWMTRARARHPRARRFVSPGQATMNAGFRSCTF